MVRSSEPSLVQTPTDRSWPGVQSVGPFVALSISHQHTESAECSYCGNDRDPIDSVHGSFCSHHCLYKSKGEGVLRHVRQDQRFCATCFRQVKSIERPPGRLKDRLEPQTSRALIGRQYPTPNTVWAVDDRVGPNAYSAIEHQRWGCSCGACDPGERTWVLADVDRMATASALLSLLNRLWSEDRVENEPSEPPLIEVVESAGGTDPVDWALAAGSAVYRT